MKDKYSNEFSEQCLISCEGFGIVSKIMHKNSKKTYAIKKIALTKEELEKAFKELNIMNKLKSRYVVECIDFWIEENTLFEFLMKISSSSAINSSHRILDPKNTVLLHIQMEFCSKTLKEVIEDLLNELRENAQQIMKSSFYFICCELLTEILECFHYLHGRNIIHRDFKPVKSNRFSTKLHSYSLKK